MDSLNNNGTFIAILGDIIDSKTNANRNDIQIKLKKTINLINEKYSEDIEANFSIVRGDGFQGLLKLTTNTMNIIGDIEIAMYPTRFRFGVGVGKVSTDISTNVYEIDGECFHHARNMIEEVTKSKEGTVMVCTGNSESDILLNTILRLSDSIKKSWTKKQWEVIHIYIEMDQVQVRVAEELGIDKSSVSKSISKSDFISYKNALDVVSNHLFLGGSDNGIK